MSRDEVGGYLDMARENLDAASLLRDADIGRAALASAYLSMHQAARALLATRGLGAKTHRGMLSLLREHFSGPDGLPRELYRVLARLQSLRESSQYEAGFAPKEAQVDGAVEDARRFLSHVEAMVAKGPADGVDQSA